METKMSPMRRTACFLFAGLVILGLSGMPSWLHMGSVHQPEGAACGNAHCAGHCPESSGMPGSPVDEPGHSPADGAKDSPHDSSRCDTCQILGSLKANEPILPVFHADWSLIVAKAPSACEGILSVTPTHRQPPCRAPPRTF